MQNLHILINCSLENREFEIYTIITNLGTLLVGFSFHTEKTAQQEERYFQLDKNLGQTANSSQHLANKTVSSAQGWVHLSTHT